MVKEKINGMIGEIEVQSKSKVEQILQRESNNDIDKKIDSLTKLLLKIDKQITKLDEKLEEDK